MSGNSVLSAILRYGGLLAVLLVLVVFFSLRSESFFQYGTVVLIANQIPELTLIAVGMTLILIIGQIDLSVGSVMALSSAVIGTLMVESRWPMFAAIPIGVMLGGCCGLATGAISIRFGVPSFIVSLGMLEIARGAARRVLDSRTLSLGNEISIFSEPLPIVRLSPIFVVAVGVVVAMQLVLTRTVFGRYCVAIGTNPQAARLAGIRTTPYAIGVFIISGVLCGFASLAPTSLMEASDPGAGVGIELAAIAACVIGGTSLMGGRGNVMCTFLGVLIIAVLQTGLSRMSVEDENKQMITGGVIIGAVLLDIVRERWNVTRRAFPAAPSA